MKKPIYKKTSAAKTGKKKPTGSVAPEKAFWFCDGQVARNLKELVDILGKIPQNVFEYHANAGKNDFSRWIVDVFGEAGLARSIQKIKSAKATAEKIKAKL
ncbi:MAG: DUF5752 family protein [Candidatus Pacebacteria bacterium]|nr:DUF5752 family protein [Candidatus Paceibacterota bacterium]